MADSIACVYCGKPMGAGQPHCPHCGAPASAAAQPPAARLSQGKAPSAALPAAHRASATCSACGFPVGATDIICTHCGVNLLTGQQIAEVRTLPVKPRREYSLLWPVLAVAAVLAIVVLLGALFYQLTRDPVGEALQLAKDGKVGAAIDGLREYLKGHSTDPKAQMLLGKLLWGDRQFRQASDAFSAVCEIDPRNAEAPLLAGVALHKAREEGSAGREQAFWSTAAKVAPNDGRAVMLEALSFGVAKDYGAQGGRLKVSVESGGPPMARVEWAASEALQGNLDVVGSILGEPEPEAAGPANAVLGLVANLKGQTQEAHARLEAAVQAGANDLVKARLAALYLAEGEYAKALPLLEQARTRGAKADSADWMYAACLVGMGSNVEAIRAYDDLSKRKGPYAAAAALELANLYLALGDTAKANESVLLASQNGDDSAKLHTLRGRVRMKEGDASAAMEAYTQALAKDPGYPAAHLEMGLQYLAQGVLAEGLHELERFLETGRASGGGGPIVNEIELLVEQLKQTVQSQG